MQGNLKNVVFCDTVANLDELKAQIKQHNHNVTPETFRSGAEHAAYRFQLVAENGELPTEQVKP